MRDFVQLVNESPWTVGIVCAVGISFVYSVVERVCEAFEAKYKAASAASKADK